MVSQVLTAPAQSSHTLQSVEAYIERLSQKIKVLQTQLEEVKKVPKYTLEIRRKISKIEAEIESRERTVTNCRCMLNFPPGSSVRNGTNKPGKVINLVIAGEIPEVHVQWHGTTFSVPESPTKLTLVEPKLLGYVWNGDRYPKLIRPFDGIECDEILILEQELSKCAADRNDPDRSFKIIYIKKRITLIDKLDLDNLERAVKQGLEVFYRVGEALAEIRDRALYKQHGYKDFRQYLKEKWNMGKSQAYRLIDSNEVINNLKQESVPHGGQNILDFESVHHGGQKILPGSERITRELAKLPSEQQSEAWKKAIETAGDNNPTAAHTKAVVEQIINDSDNKEFLLTINSKNINNCPDNSFTVQINNFEVGHLVQIKSDRSDKRLVGYNLSVGVVTQINPATVNLKIWGQKIDNVSPNDLKILDESNLPAICFCPPVEEYKKLLIGFDSKEEIFAIALRSLK